MSRIVRIASWKGTPRASVVFVHGLGGHVYNTWRCAADDDTFWPLWLARDVEGLAVYSLAYEAPASNWLGTSMPLQDRAVNIFEVLLTEPGLRTGPVIFVCHSLGGLIVKKVLLNLQQQAMRRPEAADLAGTRDGSRIRRHAAHRLGAGNVARPVAVPGLAVIYRESSCRQ